MLKLLVALGKYHKYLARHGNVALSEMEKVFNLGIGYVLVVNKESVSKIQQIIETSGRKSYLIGEIAKGNGNVLLDNA